jgi:tRNA modification GTPase
MLTDTIVALATAPGRAALAVVRLSGSGAFAVAAKVVDGFRADRPRLATLASFRDADGRRIDRGLYLAFPGPHSYTGEDLVELTCHGGTTVVAMLLGSLHAAGARPAAPGEFTRRAVMNGKLDLIQAEGVADLVDSSAPAQARAALHQVEGGLSAAVQSLYAQLLDLVALLGYDLDFPGEDDGPISPDHLLAHLGEVAGGVERLLQTAPVGERLRSGALVVLAGAPNSGKSSLFNALLGTERALVAAVPGTTRDAVEADTAFDGWPIRLVDTAGLRETDEMVEQMGIEVSRRYLAAADLVLLCAEAGRPLDAGAEAMLGRPKVILARTKADLVPAGPGPEMLGIVVSVRSGEGLAALRAAVADQVFGREDARPVPELEPMVQRQRHQVALKRAAESLDAARQLLLTGGEAALVAHEVQRAGEALGELLGPVNPDDILGRIFSRFCVGK